jgi:hypothetical protein
MRKTLFVIGELEKTNQYDVIPIKPNMATSSSRYEMKLLYVKEFQ